MSELRSTDNYYDSDAGNTSTDGQNTTPVQAEQDAATQPAENTAQPTQGNPWYFDQPWTIGYDWN